MNSPRADHTATLLEDGRLLVAGGFDAQGFLSSAEIYDTDASGLMEFDNFYGYPPRVSCRSEAFGWKSLGGGRSEQDWWEDLL
jgi:hypothetical protein